MENTKDDEMSRFESLDKDIQGKGEQLNTKEQIDDVQSNSANENVISDGAEISSEAEKKIEAEDKTVETGEKSEIEETDKKSETDKSTDKADDSGEKSEEKSEEVDRDFDNASDAEKRSEDTDKSLATEKIEAEKTDIEKTEAEKSETEKSETEKSETEAAASAVMTAGVGGVISNTAGVQEVFEDRSLMDSYKKKGKVLKFFKVLGISVAAIVVCAYVAVSVWFTFHYNNDTYINGQNYSFCSVADLSNAVSDYISNYSLKLALRCGDSHVINPEDIDMVIEPDTSAKELCNQQNGFLWPMYISGKKEYEFTYTGTYNEEKLKSLLASYDCASETAMVEPTDAYVVIKDGEPEVVADTEGSYIELDNMCQLVEENLTEVSTEADLTETDAYRSANITADSDAIAKQVQSLSDKLNMVITCKIDQVSWEITSEDYGNWMVQYKGNWSFSESKIREYVEEMAEKYDTYGTERKFVTHTGKTITQVGPYYGWKLDVDAETASLKEVLEQGKNVVHEPIFETKGAVYTELNDIGDSYVECDLGQQHIYVYIDGKVVMESDCVSGSVASGRETPEGVYEISLVKTPAILIGEDYETPVTFWMPFTNNGIGFHDATWRSKFGGEIYRSSGSHGCVNLPYAAAQELFNIAYVGLPVVCYY